MNKTLRATQTRPAGRRHAGGRKPAEPRFGTGWYVAAQGYRAEPCVAFRQVRRFRGAVDHLAEGHDRRGESGQRVFYDMKPNGEGRWVGKAFNPEDGKTYSGKVSVNGKQMVTEGCALAGLVCRSVNWRGSTETVPESGKAV